MRRYVKQLNIFLSQALLLVTAALVALRGKIFSSVSTSQTWFEVETKQIEIDYTLEKPSFFFAG